MSEESAAQRLQLVKNTLFSSIAAFSSVLLLILFMMAARVMGVEALGALALGLAIANGLAPVLDLGINSLAIRRIASSTDSTSETAVHLLGLRTLSCAVFLAVYFPAVILLVDDELLRSTVLVFGVAGMLRCFNFSFRALLQAQERFLTESLLVILDTVLILLVGVTVLLNGGGPVALGWTFLAVRAATFICYLVLSLRIIQTGSWKWDWPAMWAMLREAFPLGVAGMLSAVFWQSDTLLLTALSTAYATGIFMAVFRIIAELRVIPDVLSRVVYPRLAAWQNGSWNRFDDLLARSCKYMLLIGGGIASVGAFNSAEIIHLLYGPEFADSADVFTLLIFVPLLFLIQPILTAALRAIGKQSAVMWVMGASVLIKGALGVLLIPGFGAMGAAIAAVCGVAFSSIASMIIVEKFRRQLIVRTRWLARVVASMLIALAVAVLLQDYQLLLSLPCTAVVYAICLRVLGVFDKYELELVDKLARKVTVFRKSR